MASKDSKKCKNVFQSFKYAFEGLKYGFANTNNIHIDLFFAFAVIICGFIFKIHFVEWAILLGCIALVISLELLNTAIEAVVDLASPNIHPLAKIGKDVAAGAVLFSAIMSAIIGIIIFLPKFIDLF